MEQINALWQYLSGFALWQEKTPVVDTTPAAPDGCGLFPRGVEVLERKLDVAGDERLRLRQSFLLRRRAARTAQAAAWLMELQSWVLTNPPRHLEPVFGTDLQLRMEKGRLTRAEQPGTATYEGIIIMEYTKENCVNEN